MKKKSTIELQEELTSRERVTEIVICPYETFKIVQDQHTHDFTGPARVLINQKQKVAVHIMNELEVLAAPLIEILNNNFNPHCRIEITQDFTRVVEDVIGIPKNYRTGE